MGMENAHGPNTLFGLGQESKPVPGEHMFLEPTLLGGPAGSKADCHPVIYSNLVRLHARPTLSDRNTQETRHRPKHKTGRVTMTGRSQRGDGAQVVHVAGTAAAPSAAGRLAVKNWLGWQL